MYSRLLNHNLTNLRSRLTDLEPKFVNAFSYFPTAASHATNAKRCLGYDVYQLEEVIHVRLTFSWSQHRSDEHIHHVP